MPNKKSPIPTLPEKELLSRAFRIKALKRDDEGKIHFIEPCDIQTVAFAWDPKLAGEATGLTKLRDITTFHNYAAPVFFKPDIGEVLAQIPPDVLDTVTAFTTEPDYDNQFTEGGSYHRGVTTLYTGELPATVRDAPVIYKKKPVAPPPREISIMKPVQFKKGPRP
jgi:hypothetical protein